MDPAGFSDHDHDGCIARAVASAAEICAEKGLQLTPVRRRVLELLLADHRALGAYDILQSLSAEGFGSQPPVAYRALDFLVTNGLAHRIEGRNAFIACSQPGQPHAPAFMICRSCETVAETLSEPGDSALGDAARAAGFVIERAVVEAEGLCPKCQDTAS